MLAASVYTGKGLFMKQAYKAVSCCHLLHDLHGKLIVVGGNICSGINGCQLMLCRSNLVVFGLCKDSQFPELLIKIRHIFRNLRLYHTKVVIAHFLTLGGLGTEKCTSSKDKIFSLIEHFFRNKEILLLRSYRCLNAFDLVVAEEMKNTKCFFVQRRHRPEKRSLFVQRLTAVRAERGGNAKSISFDKCVGGGVPRSVSSCLKCCTETS